MGAVVAPEELLIGDAVALIESGQASTVLIFRAMNGRSGVRMGGGRLEYGPLLQTAIDGGSFIIPYGMASPSQWFGMFATRHMHEAGITQEDLGHVCVSFMSMHNAIRKRCFTASR